jgi:hypothetical protein
MNISYISVFSFGFYFSVKRNTPPLHILCNIKYEVGNKRSVSYGILYRAIIKNSTEDARLNFIPKHHLLFLNGNRQTLNGKAFARSLVSLHDFFAVNNIYSGRQSVFVQKHPFTIQSIDATTHTSGCHIKGRYTGPCI